MARCTSCNHKWRIRDIWLLGFKKQGKKCTNCDTRQYLSFKDRGLLMGLGYVSTVAAVFILIFFPFLLKLSAQDETVY